MLKYSKMESWKSGSFKPRSQGTVLHIRSFPKEAGSQKANALIQELAFYKQLVRGTVHKKGNTRENVIPPMVAVCSILESGTGHIPYI